jgi:hypothetical protein
MNVQSYRQRSAATRQQQRTSSDSKSDTKQKEIINAKSRNTVLVAKPILRHLPHTQRPATFAVAHRTSDLSRYSLPPFTKNPPGSVRSAKQDAAARAWA